MFSGIIEEKAKVVSIEDKEPLTIGVESKLEHKLTKLGDSIALNGVCLTVVKISEKIIYFELSPETVQRTTFSTIKSGSFVNLERALLVGERLHGHFVTGHIDNVIKLVSLEDQGSCRKLIFEIDDKLRKYVAEKGSIAINGVSLTVNEVQGNNFCITIIPHTLDNTNLADLKIGAEVNVEVDILARYILERPNEQ